MTTQQIADRLVELCRKGDIETTQKELFTEDTISIEPFSSAGFEKETKGLTAIVEKAKNFMSMVEEFHSNSISDPIIAGNSFAIIWTMDATMKGKGRTTMSELCVYEVKDGKILSESFHM